MTVSASRPLWQGRVLALLGIVLFAFSLRSAVASLSPVLGFIRADFDVAAWVVGAIGTAPPACYAVAGLLTPALERRLGLERLAAAALIVVTGGLVARGLATDATGLTVSTAVIFAGVGVGNILLPPLVKKHFPDRVGLMTTLYSTTLALSTMLPPLFAVPVADAAGWRTSLALWAVFGAVAMLPWVALLVRTRNDRAVDLERVDTRMLGRLWRLPLAWSLMTVFFVSSTIAYTSFAWLPTILVDLSGVSPATAGTLLSLFAMVGLPAALVVPVLVTRFRAVPALLVVAIVAGLAGVGGLMFAPAVAPALWVVLLGATPLFFPLSLVLIGVRARTHEGALVLSVFVQGIGYAVVALVPLAVGIIHDLTGSWTGPLILLAVVIVTAIPAGFRVARMHTIEDEWERLHGRPW